MQAVVNALRAKVMRQLEMEGLIEQPHPEVGTATTDHMWSSCISSVFSCVEFSTFSVVYIMHYTGPRSQVLPTSYCRDVCNKAWHVCNLHFVVSQHTQPCIKQHPLQGSLTEYEASLFACGKCFISFVPTPKVYYFAEASST